MFVADVRKGRIYCRFSVPPKTRIIRDTSSNDYFFSLSFFSCRGCSVQRSLQKTAGIKNWSIENFRPFWNDTIYYIVYIKVYEFTQNNGKHYHLQTIYVYLDLPDMYNSHILPGFSWWSSAHTLTHISGRSRPFSLWMSSILWGWSLKGPFFFENKDHFGSRYINTARFQWTAKSFAKITQMKSGKSSEPSTSITVLNMWILQAVYLGNL